MRPQRAPRLRRPHATTRREIGGRGGVRRVGVRRRTGRRRAGRGRRARGMASGARHRLRHFRQASLLAVAFTTLLLMIVTPGDPGSAQDAPQDTAAAAQDTLTLGEIPDTVAVIRQIPVEDLQRGAAEEERAARPDSAAKEGTEEAAETLRTLWIDLHAALPKIGIALGVLLTAWLLVRVLRPLLRTVMRSWGRANAVTALFGVVVWILAAGVALTVLTGDILALAGSFGLVGLALSWALQTPIESFTGWLLNSFQGYYRVGDRIAVGEVYGDVYAIDLLTTTVWEYGGPDRAGVPVHGEQPTGRIITFPNNEVLTGSIVNYTRDFPYVWDELVLEFSPETDTPYLLERLRTIAEETVGEYMLPRAREYGALLARVGLESGVAEKPQVYLSAGQDGRLEAIIRYLVGARERRKWSSDLLVAVTEALRDEEAQARIRATLPRRFVQFLDAEGHPTESGGGPTA